MSPSDKAFDESKYKALMDGLEAVEIKLSKVFCDNLSFRFDSEYFQKKYIIDLYNTKKLIEVVKKITVGFVGTMVKEYSLNLNDPRLLQTANISEVFINDFDIKHINLSFHNALKKSQVFFEDILIARSGSFGKAGIYLDTVVVNSSDIIIIRCNKDIINPYFLTAFLNSKLGKAQMLRFASGGLQCHVNLTILENLAIPSFSSEFQDIFENILSYSWNLVNTSKLLYIQAETLLLSHLNLSSYTPNPNGITQKSFKSSFGVSGRLDSEYYQPKYDELLTVLQSYKNGCCQLVNYIDNYSTGYPFSSDLYLDNESKECAYLVRINNISSVGIDISNAAKIPSDAVKLSPKDKLFLNDILISMSGSIGISCRVQEDILGVINQRIMRITVKDFDTNVMCLIINSIIGRLQLERIGTGGVQTNISSNDIKEIMIPILPFEVQAEISKKIQDSFSLRKKSAELLELAKKAVEVAIEEGEDVAMRLLEGVLDENQMD